MIFSFTLSLVSPYCMYMILTLSVSSTPGMDKAYTC
jgi:hypothetical protein